MILSLSSTHIVKNVKGSLIRLEPWLTRFMSAQGVELVDDWHEGGRPRVGLAASAPAAGEGLEVGLGRFFMRLEVGPEADFASSLPPTPLSDLFSLCLFPSLGELPVVSESSFSISGSPPPASESPISEPDPS